MNPGGRRGVEPTRPATIARLQQTLAEQVTSVCTCTIRDKYPFKLTSEEDIVRSRTSRSCSARAAASIASTPQIWPSSPTPRNLSGRGTPPIPSLASCRGRSSVISSAPTISAKPFFPQGTAGFAFAVKNVMIGEGIDTARLEINTGVLTVDKPGTLSGFNNVPPTPSPPPPPQVVIFQWPGPIGLGAASLTFLPAIPGRADLRRRRARGRCSGFSARPRSPALAMP